MASVRIVRETGRPIAQIARELGINSGTLGNWVAMDLKRSVVLWVKEATK